MKHLQAVTFKYRFHTPWSIHSNIYKWEAIYQVQPASFNQLSTTPKWNKKGIFAICHTEHSIQMEVGDITSLYTEIL